MTTVPSAPPTSPPAPPDPSGSPSSWRAAWVEILARTRAATTTEPGRLRIIAAVLAGLMLLFGAATASQLNDRAAATGTVVEESQPLTADTGALLRSLAEANSTAAAGILTDGQEAYEVRERYEESISRAAALLNTAATQTDGSRSAEEYVTLLSEEIPVYTGLVEAARANDRQGYPLGGAYLRYADEHMQSTLLPAAEQLYELERSRYQNDLDQARSWPWLALLTGVLALTALVLVQRRHYLRTNRVFNRGLVTATAAGLMLLLWLVTGHALAASALGTADRDGARSLHVLNEVRTESLRALGDEHMTLVMRGAGQEFADSYDERMRNIRGGTVTRDGLLDTAYELADDDRGRELVDEAASRAEKWDDRHEEMMVAVAAGDHESAVSRVIHGSGNRTTGYAANELDEQLDTAIAHEQEQFDEAAGRAGGWFAGLTATAVVVGVIGAGAAVLGIGRRLSEYR